METKVLRKRWQQLKLPRKTAINIEANERSRKGQIIHFSDIRKVRPFVKNIFFYMRKLAELC